MSPELPVRARSAEWWQTVVIHSAVHCALGARGPLTCLYGTEMLLAELLEFSGMFNSLNN